MTSDPKKMLNNVPCKTCPQNMGGIFSLMKIQVNRTIERNEILFDRGTLIDQDTLAKIRFSMEADGIKEVEVSNQNRLAFEKREQCFISVHRSSANR